VMVVPMRSSDTFKKVSYTASEATLKLAMAF